MRIDKIFKKSLTKFIASFAFAILLILAIHPLNLVRAHNLDQSYLYFNITENKILARAEVPVQDLNDVLNLGLPEDRALDAARIEPQLPAIRNYVEQNSSVQCEPQDCKLIFQRYDLLDATTQFLQLTYELEGTETRPDKLRIAYDVILNEKDDYTNMLLVEQNWETGTFDNEANPFEVFNETGKTYELDLTSGSFFRGLTSIFKLGIGHILSGNDHILFIIALLLPSVLQRSEDRRWQSIEGVQEAFFYIVKVATAFAVAHSITLSLAALNIVQISPRLTESMIAASIGLAALEIFYPIFKGRMWMMVFIFGLFHGSGFAQTLTKVGVMSRHALWSLLSFNLGIESGQIIIIAIAFPILYLLRTQKFYQSILLRAGGVCLGLISLYWFIERAFGINLALKTVLRQLLPG